jgi:hypothetical protein
MNIHPEVGRQLATAKIDEARFRTDRARTAQSNRRAAAVTDRSGEPTLAKVIRWLARRTSLRANAPWTPNG